MPSAKALASALEIDLDDLRQTAQQMALPASANFGKSESMIAIFERAIG